MTYKFRGTFGFDDNSGEASNQPDWIIAFADVRPGKYAYASNSDRTSWTSASYTPSNPNATFGAAVGKNAAGNGIFIVTQKVGGGGTNHEIVVSGDDITDGNTWTRTSLAHPEFPSGTAADDIITRILWSNDSTGSTAGVWLAATHDGTVFRSTDGAANWTALTKVGGHLPANWNFEGIDENRQQVLGMTANGSGEWVMAQSSSLYKSTDDGANFTEISHGISNVEKFYGAIYTNNSYVVVYDRDDDDKIYLRSAADSDLTTWSSEIQFTINLPGNAGRIDDVRLAANSSGRVVFISPDRTDVGFVDVNGTSTSNNTVVSSAVTAARDIATNGNGVWLVTCENGEIFESTNDGASWSRIVNQLHGSHSNINCIASNYYLPL